MYSSTSTCTTEQVTQAAAELFCTPELTEYVRIADEVLRDPSAGPRDHDAHVRYCTFIAGYALRGINPGDMLKRVTGEHRPRLAAAPGDTDEALRARLRALQERLSQ